MTANDTLSCAKYWRRERRALVMGRQIVRRHIGIAGWSRNVRQTVNVSGEKKS